MILPLISAVISTRFFGTQEIGAVAEEKRLRRD
jgi:hypothetical protein